ncbi:HEAT repeat-containing protein 4 isoform X2 [Conger conger]|uniref:HEAT repeat-containing protein 4 isoform X2 n=1 Tax=Conger conger TaxID=82655 RepID=UPI002A59BC1F|nr:HEAT repeat-containing protein 4 isoform X2 [Conger conger]
MDLLQSQNSLVNVGDLQNMRQSQVFLQLLHSATHSLTFSQDVVWERAAETVSYSKTDFRWLFCSFGPPASSNPKSRRTVTLRHLPQLSSPPVHVGAHSSREHLVAPLAHLPNQPILVTAEDSIITPSKKRPLADRGNRKDQSSCRDKKPARIMPEGIPQQHQINRIMTEGRPQQHQIKQWLQHGLKGPATNLMSEVLVSQADLSTDQDLLKEAPHINQSKTALPTHDRVPRFNLPSVHANQHSGSNSTTNSVTIKYSETCLQPQDFLNRQTSSYANQTEYSSQTLPFAGISLPALQCSAKGQNGIVVDIEAQHQKQLQQGFPSGPDEGTEAGETTCLSITSEGLKKAFTDLDHHVRLEAIATCALRAINGAKEDQDSVHTEFDPVLQELQPLLLSALDDDHVCVQTAAAVCQYAMGLPSLRAREILHSILHEGACADVWLAAQCLAAGGGASLPIIQVLLSRLFGSELQREQEQATTLLANISIKTTVVRTLLAKELNCANWRNRVMACKTIGQLKGLVNKDLVSKLTQLMWKDCYSETRQAAAQALGALGRGRELQNELRVQLEEGPSSVRVEALVLLAHLQIMTARLLPSFLGCLRNDIVAVRKQACLTAAALCRKDEVIVNQLIELSQDDPAWGVKVAAITALGKIGSLTPLLQKILLQAIHCEEEPEVRIAACEAIRILGVDLPELQHLLQQRILLETHQQVLRHIESLMKSYGFPIKGDENIILKIKDQVQKLCSKHIITGKVLLLEELHDSQQQQRCFLGQSGQPDSSPPAMTQLLQARYRAIMHGPRTDCGRSSAHPVT